MFDADLGSYPETPFELLDRPEVREEPPPFDAGSHGFVAVAGPPQFIWSAIANAFDLLDPAPPDADVPTRAAARRAHAEVLRTVLGVDDARIAALRIAGILLGES